MRLIKIADRSDHGWNTIAAYENNELALDSEDEKKLLRAEKEAEKRATRKKSKAATTSAAPLVTTGDVAPRRHGAVLPARVGPCFGCGELGHLIGRREELGAWGNGRVELMTVVCTTDDATQYVKCHWGMERA
ncbi:hypothetical protein EMCRGX_G010011 [Ephydatia muelleri]